MKQTDGFDLEAVLDAARAAPPPMPATLMARIEADAVALLRPVPLWRRLVAGIGGAAGVAGLVTATAVGFWIGVAPPTDPLDPLVLIGAAGAVDDNDLADMSVFAWYSEEG